MIHIIRQEATRQQLDEMLQELGTYIKLAVDIQRNILAGGGQMHADCEAVLLNDGSRQADIWGADWIPSIQKAEFDALINIRPSQQNYSMTIQDPHIRQRVESIIRKLLEGV
ncbi:MAG: DUF5674 family protein [candidate division KSB1 bacterium]|nr:DUF5674 family protein [candidate division KSB1 bacterium]MDZ7301867.1 DUF5674 family protein [candidate division KSB1 bacterium]MDZ7310250.1 DUF5674 family protein [candidate division KSB1 bacterium]